MKNNLLNYKTLANSGIEPEVTIMLNFTPVRIAIILLYFVACTACGKPPEVQTGTEPESSTIASDINFIGGGTQAPDIEPDEQEYRSPTLSTPPPPTTIA